MNSNRKPKTIVRVVDRSMLFIYVVVLPAKHHSPIGRFLLRRAIAVFTANFDANLSLFAKILDRRRLDEIHVDYWLPSIIHRATASMQQRSHMSFECYVNMPVTSDATKVPTFEPSPNVRDVTIYTVRQKNCTVLFLQ